MTKKIEILYDFIKSLNIPDYDDLSESDIHQTSETEYRFRGTEGVEIWGVYTEQEAVDKVFIPYSEQWELEELIDAFLDLAYKYGYDTPEFDEDGFVDATRRELVESWKNDKSYEGVELGFAAISYDSPMIVDFVDSYYVVFEDII